MVELPSGIQQPGSGIANLRLWRAFAVLMGKNTSVVGGSRLYPVFSHRILPTTYMSVGGFRGLGVGRGTCGPGTPTVHLEQTI